MPKIQEELLIDLGEWRGIDSFTSGYYLDPKRATDLVNYMPTSRVGSLFSALGRATLTTNPPGANNPTLGLIRYDIFNATSWYIVASDATLNVTAGFFRAQAGAVSWTALTIPASLTFTAAQPTNFAQFGSYLYGVNGKDQGFKMDSAFNLTPIQSAAPTNTPNVISPIQVAPKRCTNVPGAITLTASTTGGTLASGTYFYVVTALTADGAESGKSAEASVAVVGPTGSVALSWTAATGDVAFYRIYRGTVAGGENIFYNALTNSGTDVGAANSVAGQPPAAGTLAAATYYYEITETIGASETGPSPEVSIATLGTNGSVALSWASQGAPSGYRVYRGTAVNGENVFYTSTSTKFTDIGAASTAGSPPVAPPGVLSGTYYYRLTYSNSFQETSAGSISSPITLINQQSIITNLPTTAPDPQYTTLNIYRLGGTLSVWEQVVSQALGPATFTDNVADQNLGQLLVIARDPPPVGAFSIAVHKQILWMFGTPTDPFGLFRSNFREPWAWDLTGQYFPVGLGTVNDFAQNLASTGSLLVLFKKMTTWALYGDDQTSFVLRKLFDIGCIAPRSVVSILGVIFWLARDGVWMFDGARPTRISTGIESVLYNLSLNDLNRATGSYYQGFYLLSLPTKGVTYAISLATQEIYKLGWAAEVAYTDQSVFEVTASRSGVSNIDSWFAASTDLGLAIAASFIGKIDDSGKPQGSKRYRHGVLMAPIQAGQSAAVTITVNPGALQIQNTKTFSLGNTIRNLWSIPLPSVGFQAQLQITTNSTVQVEIQKFQIYGWIEREFV